MLTGQDVQRIRKAKNLSQQELAFLSGVNKAYLSEFESGIRPSLPAPMADALERALLDPPAGRTRPEIIRKDGRQRLRLTDSDGNQFWPDVASVQWTESDGTTYSIFLGEAPS